MKRDVALNAVIALDTLIDHETQRLQMIRDNDDLDDPSTWEVLNVEEESPLKPDTIVRSAEVLARNAALKAIGDCTNLADETNARANIKLAESKVYESDESAEGQLAKDDDVRAKDLDEKVKPVKKATK